MRASGNGRHDNGMGITGVCDTPLRRKCLIAFLITEGWQF